MRAAHGMRAAAVPRIRADDQVTRISELTTRGADDQASYPDMRAVVLNLPVSARDPPTWALMLSHR